MVVDGRILRESGTFMLVCVAALNGGMASTVDWVPAGAGKMPRYGWDCHWEYRP